MQEQPDCRICDYYELVFEEFPSEKEPIFIYSYHRCNSQNTVWFTLEELKEAYSACSVRRSRIGYGIPSDIEPKWKSLTLLKQLFKEKNVLNPLERAIS